MIYGKQNYTPPSTKQPVIYTEQKLRLMLSNGPELVDTVRQIISDNKMPFTIEVDTEGNGTLKDTLSPGELYLKQFITVDEDTLKMKDESRKIAKTHYEVLVCGETGTGKELIAKSMIANRTGQVKDVSCAGLPEHLIESELFGHVKGSFTSAERDKKGMFEEAQDGVMFLDEIGELPIQVQSKLLRALQEKRIRRVGANSSIEINCKFVCATNKNLRQMVRDGKFKDDLFARISTLEIDIKPLRERMCDVIPICESLNGGKRFLEEYGAELMQGVYDLDFNVRSLQQHIARFVTLGYIKKKI